MTDTLYDEARHFLARALQGKNLTRESHHPWRKPWEFTFQHSLRVENLAFTLLAQAGGSLPPEEQQALRLSAIMHDVGRLEETPDHAARSAEIAAGWLRDHPDLAAQVTQPARVLDLIARHSQKDQPETDDLACALLKDADLLDEIGAVSIFMSANWVDHSSPYFFYDLLDRLRDRELAFCDAIALRLNTPAAQAYVRQKQDFIRAFIAQLELELAGVPRDAAELALNPAADDSAKIKSAVLDRFVSDTKAIMDKQPFIDRMLETENLTDELEDADASWLLDWGAGQLDKVLAGAADPETAGQRVNALMAVMRKINRIAGSFTDKSPESLAGDLSALYELFQQAFGHTQADQPEAPGAPSAVMSESAAQRLSAMDTRQALEYLTRWYTDGLSQ